MFDDKKEYIFAIAEEQNITRAAKKLYVAQSTLTMYLNRIENELGMKIFDRSRTPVTPTPAGLLYIEELKKIQVMENHLLWRMNQISHPQNHLSIGIGPVRSMRWIPLILPELEKAVPNVEVHVIDQGDETLVDGLIANDFDIIFGTMSVQNTELKVAELALEKIILIVPKAYQSSAATPPPEKLCF